MERSQRCARLVALVGTMIVLPACAGLPHQQPAAVEPSGVRISMADLHRMGGVPHGWQFQLPPGDPKAGRQAFLEFGCPTCHAVQGENFAVRERTAADVGPDLTGMGGHHPASYFAESILNPDAVLVEGPGYVGADGRSIMPAYSDMTLAQLTDLVAYLQSLTGSAPAPRRLAASAGGATSFLIQAYDVDPEKIDEFYAWFDREDFRAYDGLVSIDTYIGRSGQQLQLVCVFGFDNEISVARFTQQLAAPAGATKVDFARPEHYAFRSPPVYKAVGLLLP